MITSDLEPALMPSAAVAQARATVDEAKRLAELFRAEADKHAEQTAANMRKRVDEFRTRARHELERVAGQI
jgi:F0F1-type ATP synthase membrane subunit b/b'